jgi:hypothetical protein
MVLELQEYKYIILAKQHGTEIKLLPTRKRKKKKQKRNIYSSNREMADTNARMVNLKFKKQCIQIQGNISLFLNSEEFHSDCYFEVFPFCSFFPLSSNVLCFS